MLLTWSPEGTAPQEFVFRPEKLLSPEAELIERIGGDDWDNYEEFGAQFFKGKRRALRAALWIMLRRHPSDDLPKRFSDFHVGVYDVTVDYDPEEKEILRRKFREDRDIDDEQRTLILAMLGDDPEEARPLVPSESPLDTTSTPAGEPNTDG